MIIHDAAFGLAINPDLDNGDVIMSPRGLPTYLEPQPVYGPPPIVASPIIETPLPIAQQVEANVERAATSTTVITAGIRQEALQGVPRDAIHAERDANYAVRLITETPHGFHVGDIIGFPSSGHEPTYWATPKVIERVENSHTFVFREPRPAPGAIDGWTPQEPTYFSQPPIMDQRRFSVKLYTEPSRPDYGEQKGKVDFLAREIEMFGVPMSWMGDSWISNNGTLRQKALWGISFQSAYLTRFDRNGVLLKTNGPHGFKVGEIIGLSRGSDPNFKRGLRKIVSVPQPNEVTYFETGDFPAAYSGGGFAIQLHSNESARAEEDAERIRHTGEWEERDAARRAEGQRRAEAIAAEMRRQAAGTVQIQPVQIQPSFPGGGAIAPTPSPGITVSSQGEQAPPGYYWTGTGRSEQLVPVPPGGVPSPWTSLLEPLRTVSLPPVKPSALPFLLGAGALFVFLRGRS